ASCNSFYYLRNVGVVCFRSIISRTYSASTN
ncbi:Phosphate transport system permease protein PstC, partial [Haemophilus influenzae]